MDNDVRLRGEARQGSKPRTTTKEQGSDKSTRESVAVSMSVPVLYVSVPVYLISTLIISSGSVIIVIMIITSSSSSSSSSSLLLLLLHYCYDCYHHYDYCYYYVHYDYC